MTCRLGRYYLHIRRRYKSILTCRSRQSLPIRSTFVFRFLPYRAPYSFRIITFPLYLYVRDAPNWILKYVLLFFRNAFYSGKDRGIAN